MNTSKTRAKTAGATLTTLNSLQNNESSTAFNYSKYFSNGKIPWSLKKNNTNISNLSKSARPHTPNQIQSQNNNDNGANPSTNFQYLLLPPPRNEHPVNFITFPTSTGNKEEVENQTKWLAPSLPKPKTSHSAKRFAKSIPSLINLSSINLSSTTSKSTSNLNATSSSTSTTTSTTRLIRANRYRKHLTGHDDKLSTRISMPQTNDSDNGTKSVRETTSHSQSQSQPPVNYTKNVSTKKPNVKTKRGDKNHHPHGKSGQKLGKIEKTLTINDIKKPISNLNGLTLSDVTTEGRTIGDSLQNDDSIKLVPVSSLLLSSTTIGKSTTSLPSGAGHSHPVSSSERMQVIRTEEEKERNPDTIRLDKCGLKQFPLVSPITEPHLKLLSLQHNLISRLENVPSLNHLVVLDLYDNRIERISGLQGLNSLRVLLLGKNRIRRIEGLDGLKRLEVLDLHGNQLRYVDNIGCLTSIRVLNLAGNNFKTIRLGSYGLLSLTELNLKRNRIRNLEGLQKAPHLKKLLLANNELCTPSCLYPLRKLVFLQEILLDPNPLCTAPDYTSQVVTLFPWLDILDREAVTDQQRIEAKIWHRKRIAEEEEKKNNSKNDITKVRVPILKSREEIIVEARRRWQSVKNFVKNSNSKDLSHDNDHENEEVEKIPPPSSSSTASQNTAVAKIGEKPIEKEKKSNPDESEQVKLNNNNNTPLNSSSMSSNVKSYQIHLHSNKRENLIRVSNDDGKSIFTKISAIPMDEIIPSSIKSCPSHENLVEQNKKLKVEEKENEENCSNDEISLEKTIKHPIQKIKEKQQQNIQNLQHSKIAVVRPLIRFQEEKSITENKEEFNSNLVVKNDNENSNDNLSFNKIKDNLHDDDDDEHQSLKENCGEKSDTNQNTQKENNKSNIKPVVKSRSNLNGESRKPTKTSKSTSKFKPRSKVEKKLGGEFQFNLQKLNEDYAIEEVEEEDEDNDNDEEVQNMENNIECKLGKESSIARQIQMKLEKAGEEENDNDDDNENAVEQEDEDDDKFESLIQQNDTDFMDETSASDEIPKDKINMNDTNENEAAGYNDKLGGDKTVQNSNANEFDNTRNNMSNTKDNNININNNKPDAEALILEKLENVLSQKRQKESNRVLRRSLSTFSLTSPSSNLTLNTSANTTNNNSNNIGEQSSSNLSVPNVDASNSSSSLPSSSSAVNLRASSAIDISKSSQPPPRTNNNTDGRSKDALLSFKRSHTHRSASFDVRIPSSESDSSIDDDTSSIMNFKSNTNTESRGHQFHRKFFPRNRKFKRDRTGVTSSKGQSTGLSSARRPQTVNRDGIRNSTTRVLKRCDSAVSISELSPSSTSTALSSAMKKQGTDYLVEIDGKVLNIYGQGALKYTLMGFPSSLTANVTTAKFHYISFDTIIPFFGKFRQIYPNLEHFQFRANNLCTLAQLNALSDLQGLTTLQITKEGNPIVANELWQSYAAYRLAHWGLQNINGKEVASEYRGGVLHAPAKAFESLGYVALSCLPQTALTPLARRLHNNHCFCSCSPSGSSDDSGRRKTGNEPQNNPCTSWDDDPVLLDVIGKEALVYSPPTMEKDRRKEKTDIPVKIIKSGGEILEKLDMLDKVWPSLLHDLVQDIIGLDYLFMDNYMKKEMKKTQDIALMSKK